MAFIDKLEVIMGAELPRPDQQYIARYVVQPIIVHDFQAIPGAIVRMKRYGYWNDEGSYTEAARRRDRSQVIGTANAKTISQSHVDIYLNEYTGPAAGPGPLADQPGTFRIEKQTLMEARRNILDIRQLDQFHESIGSKTLFQDYRKFKDSVYINLLLSANPITSTGGQQANDKVGGYYNPAGKPNGGTYDAASGPPIFTIERDLIHIVQDMKSRLVPPFMSNLGPMYHCLASPGFMEALYRDKRFLEVTKYPGVPSSMIANPDPAAPPFMPPFANWSDNPTAFNIAGPFFGQTGYGFGDFMPVGLPYYGVRFFECMNIPQAITQLTYNNIGDPRYPNQTNANTVGHQAIFFGANTIGEAIWGNGPEVLVSGDDDYGRFITMIWREYAGYVVLSPGNITVARTY